MTLTVQRRFTDPTRPVAQMFGWERRDCGVSCKRKILCPEKWSQNACDVLADKYLRKAGVPNATSSVVEEGVPDTLLRQKIVAVVSTTYKHSAAQAFHRI